MSGEAKTSRLKSAAWIVGLLAVLALVAFRPLAQLFKPVRPGVRVVLWHSQRGQERDTLEKLMRAFNAAHDGQVYVEPLGVPENSFKDKLVRNIPRGSGPDLFIRPHNELGELHAEQVVGEVGGDELFGVYPRKLVEGLSVGPAHYGLPLTYKGLFLFYNRALLPEGPPQDSSELAALRQRLPQGSFPLAYDATDFFFHAPLFIGSGERIFSDQDLGGGRRAFAVFERDQDSSFRLPGEWRRAGILPPEPNYNEMARLFGAGQAAAIVNGPWFQPGGEIARSGQWDVAPLFAIGGKPTGSFVTVEGLFLSAESKHKAEALEVARFLTGPEGARARYQDLGLPPSVEIDLGPAPDPSDATALRRHKMVAVQKAALENGVVTPNDVRMGGVWTPAKDLLSASVAGRDFGEALASSRRMLSLVDKADPEPSDWKPYGALLAFLLIGGTWMTALKVRQGISGYEASKAALTGFHGRAALPFLIPGILAVVTLVFIPLIVGAGMSLYTHKTGTFTFVGLENFKEILAPPMSELFKARSFYFALAVTVLWTVVNVFFHVTIGMGMALLLRPSWNKLRTFYRLILILPWAIPNYITALMWKGMFNAQVGAVNVLLKPFGFEGFNWFDRFLTAFTANLVTNMWLGFPFMMVVTLGALQSIPAEQEEAATLDGASRWQRFWLVIFPHLKPALVPSIILGAVWTFNAFNIIYLVSGGEPGSQSDILISEAYRWAFERGQRYGYAAAYSVLIFLFLLLYNKLTARMEKSA